VRIIGRMKHTLHRSKLRGGSEVLIIDVPNSPALYFSTIVRAGLRYGDKERSELPHLLEHLAFEGNKDYPDGQDFAFEVEKLGAYTNAMTTETAIRYYFESSISSLDEVIRLACSQLKEPTFAPKVIKQEKAVVTQELLRYKDDDGERMWLNSMRQLYKNGYPSIAQSIESLDAISRKDLFDFYNQTHTSGNTKFLIAGALTGRVKEVLALLEQYLADYRQGEQLPWRPQELTSREARSRSLSTKLDSQAHFRLVFHSDKPDRSLLPVLRIFNTIYNVGSFSRWHHLARKKGLSYHPYSAYSVGKDSMQFFITDQTEPSKALELFTLGVRELAKIMAGDFSEREFERAKGYVTGDFESSFQKPSSFAGWYGSDFSSDIDLVSPEVYKAELEGVQPEDLKRVNDLLTSGRWVLSLVGQGIKDDEGKYRDVVRKHLG
jgi:predicted Zn-dependent peptidase